jgi:hypothetical protein
MIGPRLEISWPRAPARGGFLVRLLSLVVLAGAAGCTVGSSIGPSPTQTPSATATPGAIDHPTGATTLILRLDEGGGFVAPGFFVTEAPAFSLYGNGRVIFRMPYADPLPSIGTIYRLAPYRTIKLSEADVQTLLALALGPGRLRDAQASYQLPVADAPTTTFTIVAGGLAKTVSVNGLGVGADGGVDAAVLEALANLRAELMDYGDGVAGAVTWQPDRYRGVLMEAYGGGDQPGVAVPWPWPDVAPADFVVPTGPDLPQWPIRVMSVTDVAALDVDGLEGGARGFLLERPAGDPPGMAYAFALRPLLPDEAR